MSRHVGALTFTVCTRSVEHGGGNKGSFVTDRIELDSGLLHHQIKSHNEISTAKLIICLTFLSPFI